MSSCGLGADENESLAVTGEVLSLEAAVEGPDLEASLLEAAQHLLLFVGSHTLDEGLNGMVRRMDANSLVHPLRRSIEPSLDLGRVALQISLLSLDEVGNHLVSVEEIDQETSPGLEDPRNLFEHPEVLLLALEVSKRREEVEHLPEGVVREGKAAHVSRHPGQMRGLGQQGQGQIEAQGPKPSLPQDLSVAASSTSEVQHGSSRVLAQSSLYEVDMGLGLTPVAVSVELQILRAEPLLVPSHERMISTRPARRLSVPNPWPLNPLGSLRHPPEGTRK